MKTLYRFMTGLTLLLAMSNAYAWDKVYANDATGNVTFGSLATLIDAVQQGKDVKVSMNGAYFTCQYVFVVSSSSVACTNNTNISIQSVVPGASFGFQNDAYHAFFVVNTLGQRDVSRWSVGAHIDRGHSKDALPIQWFVN
jgi:hypothetical protein